MVGDEVREIAVEPLVELHQVREKSPSQLESTPLHGKLGQQAEFATFRVLLQIASTENTVGELLLVREVGISHLQTPVDKLQNFD